MRAMYLYFTPKLWYNKKLIVTLSQEVCKDIFKEKAMSKECKSCGNYFSGEQCDKCGWTPKKAPTKAAEPDKAHNETSPETENENTRRSDPNAGRNFLFTVIIAALAVAVFALWKSGAIFSNTREEVVTQYFKAIGDGDYDSFVKCFPKEIKADYEQDRITSGLDKKAYMQGLYNELYSEYGSDMKINATIMNEEKLDSDAYDMTAYKAQYGTAPALDEVYEVVAEVVFSGNKGSENAVLCLYVAKSGGRWRIFGMTEDLGTAGS